MKYYVLRSRFDENAFQAPLINDSEWTRRQMVNLLKGNYEGIHFPLVFKQNKQFFQKKGRKQLCDVVETWFAGLYLVSDGLIETLERGGFTGWKTFPITLLNEKEKIIEGYHGLSITGKSGRVQYEKMKPYFVKSEHPTVVPDTSGYKGFVFDNWDGSDLFLPDNRLDCIITEKAYNTLVSEGFTNIRYDSCEDFYLPDFYVEHLIKYEHLIYTDDVYL